MLQDYWNNNENCDYLHILNHHHYHCYYYFHRHVRHYCYLSSVGIYHRPLHQRNYFTINVILIIKIFITKSQNHSMKSRSNSSWPTTTATTTMNKNRNNSNNIVYDGDGGRWLLNVTNNATTRMTSKKKTQRKENNPRLLCLW